MMGTIMDLFTAGIETTSNLLGFALIYMILNPDVQTKVQEEIDSILHGNFPSLSDLGRWVLIEMLTYFGCYSSALIIVCLTRKQL